jgi:hypothetical protein
LRLASLSDEYGNMLETGWDEHGRLVRIHDAPCAIDVSLFYGDERFPTRVTEACHSDGQQSWLLTRWRYDHRGQLALSKMRRAW